jgi:hypothetical protein
MTMDICLIRCAAALMVCGDREGLGQRERIKGKRNQLGADLDQVFTVA